MCRIFFISHTCKCIAKSNLNPIRWKPHNAYKRAIDRRAGLRRVNRKMNVSQCCSGHSIWSPQVLSVVCPLVRSRRVAVSNAKTDSITYNTTRQHQQEKGGCCWALFPSDVCVRASIQKYSRVISLFY